MPIRTTSRRARLLLVDDDPDMLETLSEGLVERGFEVETARTGQIALDRIASAHFDLVVSDVRMPSLDGIRLLERARAIVPDLPVIMMTAYSAIDAAVEAVRSGAFHYLAKPFRLDELVIYIRRALDDVRVRREADTLRRGIGERPAPKGLLGRSDAMQDVYRIVDRVANAGVPVLLTGETGTGKSLLATVIHERSDRTPGPLVAVNCAALPANLLESELFGHVRGAFTGASDDSPGLFVSADGGTIFLDEIGEMPVTLQAKLLHAIERKTVRPLGGAKERPVDVRVIAATNRDLEAAVREGTFREDLLYRLNLVTIEMPPLRARLGDVSDLVGHFLEEARARHVYSPVRGISREAMARLVEYSWPGNVRELAHTIERLVLLGRGETIEVDELPPAILRAAAPKDADSFGAVVPLREMERRYATWVLAQSDGVRSRAAKRLGIDVKTLARLVEADVDDKGAARASDSERPERST